ncbi:MAG: efflux RND transporter periplasmic adaptor subunit [Spongiibacteraceae bacterium]|jgi:multidrug efflux system membrane fusion protein|nr:efflux RND transporter periplasmic adaptor subunit [Spongiibacteraceae bacterium]
MPVPVRAIAAEMTPLPIVLDALGTVTPLNRVTVRSRVDGELVELAVEEGARVKVGQLLARIDPRPYEVALAQAEGQQQQNLALLENARRTLELYESLWEQDSIARQELDDQRALVAQYEGTLKIDQARVDDARLQLSFTRITAPIDGRLGLRSVDPGNLISANSTDGLMTITQMDPIAVRFNLPEGELPRLLTRLRSGAELAVEAWNRTSTQLLGSGRLETLNNEIDTSTGTILLKAIFSNSQQLLFPNQFVNVRLRLDTLEGAVVLPAAAVQYGSRGPYVYAIVDGRAQLRLVKIGEVSGDRIAIVDGVEAGEQVVLEGVERLRDGVEVRIVQVDDGAGTDVPDGASERAASAGLPAVTDQPEQRNHA